MTSNHDSTRRALLKAAASGAAVGTAGTAGCLTLSTPADAAARTEVSGTVEYFIGSPRLASIRDDVVVLDARSENLFRRERIRGARLVPFDDLTAQRETDRGLVPDTDTIAAAFGEIGVRPSDDVVVYGESIGSRVTRTAFALESIGHTGEVYVLNGGLDGWNGRLGVGQASDPDPVTYDPDPVEDCWVDREWLAERVGSFNEDGPGLVDVRAPEAYLAAPGAPELNPDHERHGHLPGAINVHWIGNIEGRLMVAPEDLYGLYAGEGELEMDEPVVVYGDENVNPTQTWITLRAIGFEDVRLYDGGFGEWANASDRGRFPVETGTNVVIETDGDVGGGGGGDFSCTG